MIQGVYGTQIPVNIDSSLVDIYYNYHETRNSDSVETSTFRKIPSSLLRPVVYEKAYDDADSVIEGMYNLRLPMEYFSNTGFYTVYIKPKEISAVIADVGVLAAYRLSQGCLELFQRLAMMASLSNSIRTILSMSIILEIME